MRYQDARSELVAALRGEGTFGWSRMPRLAGAMAKHDAGLWDQVLSSAYHFGGRIDGAPRDRDARQRALVAMGNSGCGCGKCKRTD